MVNWNLAVGKSKEPMIHKVFNLVCDFCNSVGKYSNYEDEAPNGLDWQAQEEYRTFAAKVLGWRRFKVENGSQWDVCPECARIIHQKQEKRKNHTDVDESRI
jgi:hypothetical protein